MPMIARLIKGRRTAPERDEHVDVEEDPAGVERRGNANLVPVDGLPLSPSPLT
jgi:hypothetical protein